MRPAYYNEFDKKAAAWLRELIKGGHIAPGEVDERSITDVRPSDLAGFGQCHFFAGIGGWSVALRLAGIPDDFHVWTGSCPCQPFSVAGRGLRTADERHLWPDFRNLIGECRSPVVFGEQVASAAGREWLAGVSADVEALAYRFSAADLCAAGVGAPHIRQRLFWVADGLGARSQGRLRRGTDQGREDFYGYAGRGGATGDQRMAESEREQADEEQRGPEMFERGRRTDGPCGCGMAGGNSAGDQRLEHDAGVGREQRVAESGGRGVAGGCGAGAWSDFDLVVCRDTDELGRHKARRVEAGTFPLADGVPHRVGLLRGYGNAIVPQVAAAFIRAWREASELTGAGNP